MNKKIEEFVQPEISVVSTCDIQLNIVTMSSVGDSGNTGTGGFGEGGDGEGGDGEDDDL